MDTSDVIAAFLQGFGKWTGCSWPTQFGNGKLNLEGLKSSQAALMAGSTSGKERADWLEATRWLEQVERDAREAEKEAESARDLAILGQLEQARAHVERACQLESKYTTGPTWQELRSAIGKGLPSAKPAHC
jgi:hypothetical protein